MPRHTPEQKQAAEAAFRAGKGPIEVQAATGVALSTVASWYVTFLEGAKARAAGGGRKPSLNDEDRALLRQMLVENNRLTLAELVAAVIERTGKSVSEGAVAAAMKELGFRKVRLTKAKSKPAAQTPPRYTAEHRREPTATTYPSSLTDREWTVLEPLLVKKDPRGRKPSIDRRVLLNAVFHVVRTGIPWRAMPKDLVPWSAAWNQFRRWRDAGTIDRMYDTLHALWREACGRKAEPTTGIVDSQTVKTTGKGGRRL